MVIQGTNPFHEKPIDAAFRVKSEDANFKVHKTGKQKAKDFFSGVGNAGKKVGKGILSGTRAGVKAGHGAYNTSKAARQSVQNARVLHLKRRQEISEYKTNLLNLKHQKAIHKSNILSAKVAAVEQKRALREAKRGTHISNPDDVLAPGGSIPPRVRKAGPLSDRGYKPNKGFKTSRRGPLSDRGGSAFRVNLKGRKKGGFFS